MLPAEPAAPSVSPVLTTASDTVQSAVVDQVKLMFASFQKSLEARLLKLIIGLARLALVLPCSIRIVLSAVRMPLTAHFQLHLQWPCTQSIRLIRVPPCRIQTAWDLP